MDRFSRTETIDTEGDDPEDLFRAIEAAIEASQMASPRVAISLQWEESDTEWERDGDATVFAAARQRVKHSAYPSTVRISATEFSADSEVVARAAVWAFASTITLSGSGTDAFRSRRAYEAASRRLRHEAAAETPPAETPAEAPPAETPAEAPPAETGNAAPDEQGSERRTLLSAIEAHPTVTTLVVGLIGAAALVITKVA